MEADSIRTLRPLITGKDHDRVLAQAEFVEHIEHTLHIQIKGIHIAHIVPHRQIKIPTKLNTIVKDRLHVFGEVTAVDGQVTKLD